MSGICRYCGPTDRELRPYGPGGSDICYPCMKADPAREEAASEVYGTLLDEAAEMGGGIAVIGSEQGPLPYGGPLRR